MTVWAPYDIALRDLPRQATERARRAVLRVVSARSARWQRAHAAEPRLSRDLIALGGVLEMAPREAGTGDMVETPEQLAYALGRRDMALELLALMHLTPHDLTLMMEQDHEDR